MYKLTFIPEVENDLKPLDISIRKRILGKVQWLSNHAHELPHEPLSGQWAGTYKLRVGDYRIVYDINHKQKTLIVYAIGHRREIYK